MINLKLLKHIFLINFLLFNCKFIKVSMLDWYLNNKFLVSIPTLYYLFKWERAGSKLHEDKNAGGD